MMTRDETHAGTYERQIEAALRAQKMEAMGSLAGRMAHDFNNLLTIISGRCQLLRRRALNDASLVRDVDLIVAATERAAALTRQLLVFGRKRAVDARVLELGELVAGLASRLDQLVGDGVALTIAAAPGAGHVKADPGQLEQAVMEMVANARDAMPGGGRLTVESAQVDLDEARVRVHPGLLPGPYLALTVTDTGCGIGPEALPRIFEPFFTTRGSTGRGLGLAIVYGIVRQAGGGIEVDSEPGRGTTFRILLPRVDGVAHGAERPAPVLAPGRPSGAATILLAEDEDDVRALAAEILRQDGHTVLEARHGLDALEASRRHGGPIDLVLTDVIMPQMDGRELVRRLLLERPGTPVLFVSGYSDDRLKDHGVVRERVAFIPKPYRAGALLRKVRELLDAAPGESAPAP